VAYLAELAAETLAIQPEVRFLVVGGGKQESLVRERARELGILDRNFFMMNQVPKSEMPRILSAASVATSLFIDLPPMWANSANKFFDALAAGRPVAINHEGWLADLIRERSLGLVLDPRNHRKAAESLLNFLNGPSAREASKNAVRQVARELFDRDVLAGRLERVLTEAVAGDTTGSRPQSSIRAYSPATKRVSRAA
jgi:glycosyltransferase involved in cell wall biosynthesis